MFLDNRNVLSKNLKWNINYIRVLFIFRKKLYNFLIPYWIKRSNLTKEVIDYINRLSV